jgi:hypothetical protein
MSPTIRSKGGQPLFIGGMVAGADKCCDCGTDRCWCPDYCQYNIAVISPETCSVSTRPGCVDYQSRITIGSSIASVLDPYPGVEDCPGELSGTGSLPCRDESYVQRYDAWPGGWGLLAVVNTGVIKRPEAGVVYGVIAQVRYEAKVRCVMEDIFNASKMLLDVDAFVTVQKLSSESGPAFSLLRTRSKTVEISYNECQKVGDRACYNNDLYRKNATQKTIITPFEFTLSLETTSLGDYDQTIDTRQFGPYEGLLQSVIDAKFNATFRITSRPKCDFPVTCNCAAPLGGMRVDLGNLKQVSSPTPSSYQVSSSLIDTVWMYDRSDETVYWEGPFGLYEYDQKDPDGGQDGNGHFTRLLWRQRAELYCNLIDGVAQWFVLFTSIGITYDEDGIITHYSEDEWAGKIDCYEACEDVDNYINAGDSVPMGEPYEIEYIGRRTQPGTLECEPPPRITIRFTQIKTC